MARAYLETLADLPWNTFSGQAANKTNGKSEPKDASSGGQSNYDYSYSNFLT